MKRNAYLILSTLLISGCVPKTEIEVVQEDAPIEITHHNYFEVEDHQLTWANMFGAKEADYYVYFYSLTCSHCSELKDWIISKALELGNVYFVKESQADIIKKDVSASIGASSAAEMSILGYPSLVEIRDKIIIKNVAGKTQIQRLLSD